MRLIKKTTQAYSLFLPAFVNDFIISRNNPFATYVKGIRQVWLDEMLNYDLEFTDGRIININSLTTVPLPHSNAFINFYNNSSKERSFINDLRNDNAGELCPYCGGPECGSLDHYYPKNLVPQFAICPDNLIPSCYNCNKIKDETIPVDNNQRFWHAYYDNFLNRIIIEIILVKYGDIILFEIQAHSDLLQREKDIVNYHINQLNIKRRLHSHIRSEINGHKDQIRRDLRSKIARQQIIENYSYAIEEACNRGDHNLWSIIIKDSIIRIPQNFQILEQ